MAAASLGNTVPRIALADASSADQATPTGLGSPGCENSLWHHNMI
jgi:hypothetical protein